MKTLADDELIRHIHAAPRRAVVAVTGGGASAIGRLLSQAGGSRTLIEGVVPYSSAALDDWLSARVERYCSAATARSMAMRAFQRAAELSSRGDAPADLSDLIGLSVTASLVSDRPKRGPHRVHAAAQTLAGAIAESLELDKGARGRAAEEEVAALMLLNLWARAAGIDGQVDPRLTANDKLERREMAACHEWRLLLAGQVDAALETAGDAASTAPRETRAARDDPAEQAREAARRVLFPGAFNPRHDGHRRMAEVAARRLAAPVEHELSIANVDKPPLDYLTMADRAAHFAAGERLWLTRAATFERKAAIFPNATFVIGADTAARIGDARYHGGDPRERDRAIRALAQRGARFLVFGRRVGSAFQRAEDIPLDPALRGLCDFVSEAEFRADVSSTELRAGGDKGD